MSGKRSFEIVSLVATMSASVPLLQTIEPDEASGTEQTPAGNIGSGNDNAQKPVVVLTPTNRAAMASTPGDAEAGE